MFYLSIKVFPTFQINIEQVVDFFRRFKEYYSSNYKNTICFKSDDCEADLHIEFALEGSHLLRGNLEWIDTLYNIGVRTMGIAHWFHNEFLIAQANDTNSYPNVAPSRLKPESVLSDKGKLLVEKMIDIEQNEEYSKFVFSASKKTTFCTYYQYFTCE